MIGLIMLVFYIDLDTQLTLLLRSELLLILHLDNHIGVIWLGALGAANGSGLVCMMGLHGMKTFMNSAFHYHKCTS